VKINIFVAAILKNAANKEIFCLLQLKIPDRGKQEQIAEK